MRIFKTGPRKKSEYLLEPEFYADFKSIPGWGRAVFHHVEFCVQRFRVLTLQVLLVEASKIGM